MGLFDGLPSGWSSTKDASGVVYYFNRSTGETTYEKPEKPQKEKKTGKLPEGWAETKDGAGTTYYWNQNTGETTYDRPMKAPAVPKQQLALGYAGGPPTSAPPPGGPPPGGPPGYGAPPGGPPPSCSSS